jgi:hypothetical protein
MAAEDCTTRGVPSTLRGQSWCRGAETIIGGRRAIARLGGDSDASDGKDCKLLRQQEVWRTARALAAYVAGVKMASAKKRRKTLTADTGGDRETRRERRTSTMTARVERPLSRRLQRRGVHW